jgi:hypothetical protein
MTPELIGIITVGVALAALMLALITRIEKRLERIEATQVEQGERLARVEGALEVIRDLLFNRERTPA